MMTIRAWPTSAMLAAELLKVRKRWMPYGLLLPLVAMLALQTFAAYFAGWRGDRDLDALRTAVLPWSLPSLLDLIHYFRAILLAILAASAVGTEHGWGTVRQALIRGQTRSQYLTTKLLGIAVVGAIGFLLAFGIGLGFSAIVTALEAPDLPGGPSTTDVLLMILRAGYGIVPYALLAFCLAVVGRSTTLGVAGGLMYVFVEGIVLAILGGIGGAAADARGFFIGHNVSALLEVNRIGSVDYVSFALRDPTPTGLPDPAIAALVLALYCIGFLTISFVIFLRRDVR